LQPAEPRPGGQVPAKTERKPVERARSEEYYDVKTTVFNAHIDTIDLTQLAKLEPEAAREEIRDIASEIVAIKNVVNVDCRAGGPASGHLQRRSSRYLPATTSPTSW
jgi:hypothetical protein